MGKYIPNLHLYENETLWTWDGEEKLNETGVSVIIANEFELIEENTIDIESIKEKEWYGSQEKDEILTKLIQAVKQLNKEIKSIKEK